MNMNQKLLEQLALAKQAGTKAMAKDFFAKVPGGGDEEAPMEPGTDAQAAPSDISPEQLEELLKMLGQGGGAP